MMDSEVGEFEFRSTLKAIEQDDELQQSWHRYQLAAAAMRRELPPRMTDLSARISAAIDEESAPRLGVSRFLQPLGKVAIAASVTVVALLGVRQYQINNPVLQSGAAPTVAALDGGATGPQFQLPAGLDLPPVSARTVSTGQPSISDPRPIIIMKQAQSELVDRQQIQLYLNHFMEQHTEHAIQSRGQQGLMPYARMPQEVADGP
jgi:sigma-E factor negative regulatory protein RseA